MLGKWLEAITLRKQDARKLKIRYYLTKKCCLTLLANPVGYHCDTFSNNSGDKIENKILLESKDRSDQTSMLALGHGGAGPG
eukprot:15359800-Ditylum_brightwellii.AAC.1